MAAVEFQHVEKLYPNGVRALSDVNLSIEDGELMVFVGPSGCGKSTLLRILAGLEQPTRGNILIGGRDAGRLTPQERNIAMVFQDYALYPNMTVRGNLEFPLKMRRCSRAEMNERVARVAGLLGIETMLDRLPKQLSGGQRQRVAMGRALVREPGVFLLDEPLSNLDAKLRVQVRAEIGELQRRVQATMVYVTHDQVEAMTLGNRIAVLDKGELQQVAPPKELYDQPANVFVAGFIGNPPMNLFATRVTVDPTEQIILSVGDQALPVPRDHPLYQGLYGWADEPLTGGIRPEGLALASEGTAGLRAVLAEAEYLGHETLLHLRVAAGEPASGDVAMVARLHGMHEFVKGELIRLRVDANQLYLFEKTGKALPRREAAGADALALSVTPPHET
jgi:multiple sugar transport system ATP-binding protein